MTTAAALREAADLLDAHPDLPEPYVTTYISAGARMANVAWYLHLHDADQRADAQAIMDAVGGAWAKHHRAGLVDLTQTRGLLDLTVSVEGAAVRARDVAAWTRRPLLAEATS